MDIRISSMAVRLRERPGLNGVPLIFPPLSKMSVPIPLGAKYAELSEPEVMRGKVPPLSSGKSGFPGAI
jgi:hypothetical protein